jgi:hypothetical protein
VLYLGKRYDASFILASEALGLPLVQRLDEASMEAMWSDANINVVQQRIIRKHLKFHFGKRLFLPQKKLKEDRSIMKSRPIMDHTNTRRVVIKLKNLKSALTGCEMLV